MKITNVELFVLKSEGLYNNPEGSEEPLGPDLHGAGEGFDRRGHHRLLRHGDFRQRRKGMCRRAEMERRARAWSASTDSLRF